MQDGLGSVRGEVGVDWPELDVNGTRMYAPYGSPFGAEGSMGTAFGFTGEQTDINDLVYLRARYLNPELGVFVSVDPVETSNRYAYVSGNPIGETDPSGLFDWVNLKTMPSDSLLCIARELGLSTNEQLRVFIDSMWNAGNNAACFITEPPNYSRRFPGLRSECNLNFPLQYQSTVDKLRQGQIEIVRNCPNGVYPESSPPTIAEQEAELEAMVREELHRQMDEYERGALLAAKGAMHLPLPTPAQPIPCPTSEYNTRYFVVGFRSDASETISNLGLEVPRGADINVELYATIDLSQPFPWIKKAWFINISTEWQTAASVGISGGPIAGRMGFPEQAGDVSTFYAGGSSTPLPLVSETDVTVSEDGSTIFYVAPASAGLSLPPIYGYVAHGVSIYVGEDLLNQSPEVRQAIQDAIDMYVPIQVVE